MDSTIVRPWYVYIVRCCDNSLYTGVAMNVPRRVAEHNLGNYLAARYTRARRPVELVYWEELSNRSQACKREYEIKQMDRKDKEMLIGIGSD